MKVLLLTTSLGKNLILLSEVVRKRTFIVSHLQKLFLRSHLNWDGSFMSNASQIKILQPGSTR